MTTAWAARLAVGERPGLAAMHAVLVSRSRCWSLPGRRRCQCRAIAPAHVRAARQQNKPFLTRLDVSVPVDGQNSPELLLEVLPETGVAKTGIGEVSPKLCSQLRPGDVRGLAQVAETVRQPGVDVEPQRTAF